MYTRSNIKRNSLKFVLTTAVLVLLFSQVASADEVADRLAKLEAAASTAQGSADNAWVLMCSALVLLMTIPGLALFYGVPFRV